MNRERRKKWGVGNEIETKEWEEYFKKQLEEVDWTVVRGKRDVEKDEEEGLRKEEVVKAIKKMKDGKLIEGDGLPGKIWKYGGGKDAGMGMEYMREEKKGKG